MQPIFPPLLCRKVSLNDPADKKATKHTAAMLRSRRHKSPEGQPENVIAVAYELNQDERTAIAAGAALFIGQVTYGNAPNEQLVHVGADVAAEYYKVDEATEEKLEELRKVAENELTAATERYLDVVREQPEPAGGFDATGQARAKPGTPEADDEAAERHADELAKAITGLGAALRKLGDANLAAGF